MLLKTIVRRFVPEELKREHRFGVRYLSPKGWHKSVESRQSVDLQGPVPWITYPAQNLLKRVVQTDYRIFEYGSGNSSLWWAQRAAQVVSVEHNPDWARHVRSRAPSNLTVVSREMGAEISQRDRTKLSDFYALNLVEQQLSSETSSMQHGLRTREFSAYALELTKYPKEYFDVIVIDGMARVLAAWLAADFVKPSGFIVFDNSDRKQYNDGFAILHGKGFKRIDFYGPGPVNYYEWCTTIFAKEFEWLSVNSVIPEDQPNDLG